MADKIQGFTAPHKAAAKPKPADTAAAASNPSEVVVSEYIVKKGDTLGALAKRLNMPIAKLLELNPQLTHGANRTNKGDLIYIGEKIKTESEADVLKGQVAKAKEELAKAKQEAEKAQQEAQAQLAQAKQASEAQQVLADAKQVISDAKVFLGSMPGMNKCRSQDDAKKALEQAKTALAKIPAQDPERSGMEKKVADLEGSFKAILAQLSKLTGEVPSLVHPIDRRDFMKDIRKLDPEALALATPAQKALLIGHMADEAPDADNASKILEILRDAKRQGQIESTLEALGKLDSKGLFGSGERYMEKALPKCFLSSDLVPSQDRLAELKKLLEGTSQKGFLQGIKDVPWARKDS